MGFFNRMGAGPKVALTIAAVLITSWVVSGAFSLMNKPSDIAVGMGVVILLAVLATWITVLVRCWPSVRQRLEKFDSGRLGNIALMFFVCGFSVVYLTACGCARVGPGYSGIKVNMAGDDRGVDDIPLETGWIFYNPFTQSVFEYPYFVQTAVWTADEHEGSRNNEEVSFNSKEGLIITGDISLSYQLSQPKIPAFYVKFRSDDLNNFTHGFLRNVARDIFNEVAGHYSVEGIYGPRKEDFLKDVRERLNTELADIGVSIQQFGFIGAPRPPDSVIDALNAKVAATQQAMQAENELRKEQANAKKAIAKAEGEAEANRMLSASISDRLIEWRRLAILENAVARWNGQRPMVEGAGSGGLLLQIPIPQNGDKPMEVSKAESSADLASN